MSARRDWAEETNDRSDRGRRWTTVAVDPNGSEAMDLRRRQLDATTRLGILRSRDQFLVDAARDQRVLDVGCVDHSVEAEQNPWFLHRMIADAAAHCLGVDQNEEGIEHLRRHGFHVLRADLMEPDDRGEVARCGPFDVIIAGEVIEHLEAPTSLFELATSCLALDGRMIITTPNPYAPHRVVSGRRMLAWENVDHLFYVFPSGLVELASRSGLVLEQVGTTGPRSWRYRSLLLVGWVRARVRALRWHGPGEMDTAFLALPFLEVLSLCTRSRRAREWFGETAVYVVKRADAR